MGMYDIRQQLVENESLGTGIRGKLAARPLVDFGGVVDPTSGSAEPL